VQRLIGEAFAREPDKSDPLDLVARAVGQDAVLSVGMLVWDAARGEGLEDLTPGHQYSRRLPEIPVTPCVTRPRHAPRFYTLKRNSSTSPSRTT
jgi:hypothetical protein